MEIGIKIFPENFSYAKRIAKHCDFLEVMAIPGSNFRRLKKLDLPFTIHNIHNRWGVNLADPKKSAVNRKGIEASTRAARILGADTIVIHPGFLEHRGCSLQNTIKQVSKLDSRFIVENVCATVKGFPHVGASYTDLKRITGPTKKSICLDFPHAAEYASSRGIDYIRFIKRLLGLKPCYFHISDTKVETKKDMHLHLKEGNLDISYLENLVPDDSRVLIETAHDFRKQHDDIRILRGGARGRKGVRG